MLDYETFYTLYKEWVEHNDFIPSDDALRHFVGEIGELGTHARNMLYKLGYSFEVKLDHGRVINYHVIVRPDKTENIIEDMVKAVEEGRSLDAARLMKTIVDRTVANGKQNEPSV